MTIDRARVVLIGGTRRTKLSLETLLDYAGAEIQFAIFQRDPPRDPQWHPELESLVEHAGIPYVTYDSGESLEEETVQRVRDIAPHVIIGGGNWRSWVSPDFYEAAEYGYIGIHGSLLPEYRGWAGINWYIINGEDEYGLQMYRLSEEYDAGPLVYRADGRPFRFFVSLAKDRTIREILNEVDRRHAELWPDFLDHLRRDELVFVEQDERRATYTCHRGPEDGEIDWTQGTEELHDFIRAQGHPYPGAFSFFRNEKFKIWRTTIPEDAPTYVGRIPGKVVDRREDGSVDVLTGDGVLRIEKISVDGEEVPPREFLSSVRETLGFDARKEIRELRERVKQLEDRRGADGSDGRER